MPPSPGWHLTVTGQYSVRATVEWAALREAYVSGIVAGLSGRLGGQAW